MDGPLNKLIYLVSKLPGVGERSARRIVLYLLKNKETRLQPLADMLSETGETIVTCSVCKNLDSKNPCYLCQDERRDDNSICVVEDVSDLWAIERSGMFSGRYHVLGGVLSATSNTGPEELGIYRLYDRIKSLGASEVIIATNSTMDGQTTAFYITDMLKDLNVKTTRLASGIPIGGELEYLDEGTLQAAFSSRKSMEE